MATPSRPIDLLWDPSWETLYEAYFQELSAESVVTRWQKIDLTVAILVAITASGSAIAGWSLWSEPGWKTLWVMIAGGTALISAVHGAAAIPTRIKEQEEIRRKFSGLRTGLQTFRQELKLGIDGDTARKEFLELRRKLEESVANSRKDIALTHNLQIRVQDRLDEILHGEIKSGE